MTVIVLTGVLTALFFIRIIHCIFTSTERLLPCSQIISFRTLTIFCPRLKNLDQIAHFLIIVFLLGDLNIRYFVGAWSKLTSCFHMGQSVGLVHILNKLKGSTVEDIFYAGLFIKRVIGIYCHVLIIVKTHLILNINTQVL